MIYVCLVFITKNYSLILMQMLVLLLSHRKYLQIEFHVQQSDTCRTTIYFIILYSIMIHTLLGKMSFLIFICQKILATPIKWNTDLYGFQKTI